VHGNILRRAWLCAQRPDAGRRLIWITPCKPQAQLGVEAVLPLYELRSGSTATQLLECRLRLPRAALRLHGVIHVRRHTASGRKDETLHKTMPHAVYVTYIAPGMVLCIARQGIYINRRSTSPLYCPSGHSSLTCESPSGNKRGAVPVFLLIWFPFQGMHKTVPCAV
jgi:hypothetical protein